MMIMEWHEKAYTRAVALSYVVFGFGLLGMSVLSPQHSALLERGLKAYIGLVLMWRFRPGARGVSLGAKFNRRLAFSAGCFLILSLIVHPETASCKDVATPGTPMAFLGAAS